MIVSPYHVWVHSTAVYGPFSACCWWPALGVWASRPPWLRIWSELPQHPYCCSVTTHPLGNPVMNVCDMKIVETSNKTFTGNFQMYGKQRTDKDVSKQDVLVNINAAKSKTPIFRKKENVKNTLCQYPGIWKKEFIRTIFMSKIKECLWNTTVCPGGNKGEKAIFSFKVKVKVTRSLTLVSFERASLVEYACQIWSQYLLRFKSYSGG